MTRPHGEDGRDVATSWGWGLMIQEIMALSRNKKAEPGYLCRKQTVPNGKRWLVCAAYVQTIKHTRVKKLGGGHSQLQLPKKAHRLQSWECNPRIRGSIRGIQLMKMQPIRSHEYHLTESNKQHLREREREKMTWLNSMCLPATSINHQSKGAGGKIATHQPTADPKHGQWPMPSSPC